MKKIISIITCLILSISCFIPSYATDDSKTVVDMSTCLTSIVEYETLEDYYNSEGQLMRGTSYPTSDWDLSSSSYYFSGSTYGDQGVYLITGSPIMVATVI